MRAPVNNIIAFSSVDGPGNRTAIFLQGCNFDCKYCHNPETRHMCWHCGTCLSGCPGGALSWDDSCCPEEDASLSQLRRGDVPVARHDDASKSRRYVRFEPDKCCRCDACISNCPHGASPRIRWLTPEETWELAARQMPFISGITVSGGECTLYPEFLRELFKLAKRAGLSALIDTNGTLDFRACPELLQVTDGIMLDIKAWDSAEHAALTGASNAQVLSNAVFLARLGKLTEVRAVIAPDWYDVRRNFRDMLETLAPLYAEHPFRLKLIKFRPQGVRAPYNAANPPSAALMEELRQMALAQGFGDVVVS